VVRIPDEEAWNNSFFFLQLGPRFVTRHSKSIQWFATACAPKVSGEDTTDEFRLEQNSCLVLNFSTCVPSVSKYCAVTDASHTLLGVVVLQDLRPSLLNFLASLSSCKHFVRTRC
jgi:hypothetical protein